MARKQQNPSANVVIGLDIGTSKIAAIIGKVKEDGGIEVVGMGTHPSKGLKKGVVVNIDSTVESIQRAIDEAERMSGIKAESVSVGIAGSHIGSFNSNGMVAISNQEVQEEDVQRVIDAAQTIAIPGDQEVLHILPQEFMIDNQGGIREPIGMSGVRLEAKVHMVTESVSAAQNITKCVERCSLKVDNLILEQLASSEAVLSEDEKELGVCLVDIGGGTTDIAIFQNGAIRHSAVIPVAGDQVTNDIAMALRTPKQAAEDIKKKYACALPQLISQDEEIEVPSVGDRPARCLSRHTLVEVIEPRYEELFQLIQAELRRTDFENKIAAGIVLTGGSSLVEGAVELAEEVFHMPVRLGMPHDVSGLKEEVCNPSFATTVGLLMYAKEHQGTRFSIEKSSELSLDKESILEKMKSWFSKNF
ncbi:cell division protein FtsA [Hydrogenovibrio sp. 3SP14C1]|uniref:cell division protein FtsA n=1 Tax=Hydrogenovibrio sp. 3SP14C1 TaxID=3038774 RepID=UPI0024175EA7|nr:cell division protein FtsA [Hydrogenovibrio sp. 3SP14C1]MDG4811824.1 cell division protein FtsA [Hydrogenovibrio sp. 3SP14C1]